MLVVVAALTAGAVALGAWGVWIARPPPEPVPDEADAIVVFGGKRSRFAEGVRMAEAGVADTVVLSTGHARSSGVAGLCGQTRPFRVRCPRPDPGNTAGEAAMFAALAYEEGWDSIVAVTSTWHVRRARMLLDRCHAGDTTFVAVRGARSPLYAVTREMAALVKDSVIRGC